jgi:hypothetical protein
MVRLVSIFALGLAVFHLNGCSGLLGRSPSTRAVVPAVEDIAAAIMAAPPAGDIAVFGFRDDGGERTETTEALDEFLLAALIIAGAPVAPGVGLVDVDAGEEGKKWKKNVILPDGWRETPSPHLLSGQIHSRSPWIYSTVLLIDRESGAIANSWRYRFSEREVEGYAKELVKRRGGQQTAAAAEQKRIEVDLHIVARHSESGFVEWFEPAEGGTLQPGDKFQLRFRVRTDCTVYAFLYQSNGGLEVILESQVAYPGRLYETPGEEQWLSPQENEVYTLYFIAAASLEEDRSDLFENMAELVSQGQINRFEGLDLLDAAVVDFLSLSETETVAVLRGGEIARGKSESFAYADGETVDSRPHVLNASPVVLRALSFEVQYE